MSRIKKVFESVSLPSEGGWYWVLLEGYDHPTPCWYVPETKRGYETYDYYFLPGGIGDRSSMGIYLDDIKRIGPKIDVPDF